ncbi:hypothetical protein LNTAR_12987 [Lentisphaera araneosa HTCC2155]|uniref:Uncharacterized protein n=1 Tax=Lentisphaera araneosa HTCC2155 TaxID=313628 RepID=A6DRJ6_9BACT|nr:hypothetical protein LNTAR_12987 [Lentisphaera araneosa HTCC2155]
MTYEGISSIRWLVIPILDIIFFNILLIQHFIKSDKILSFQSFDLSFLIDLFFVIPKRIHFP